MNHLAYLLLAAEHRLPRLESSYEPIVSGAPHHNTCADETPVLHRVYRVLMTQAGVELMVGKLREANIWSDIQVSENHRRELWAWSSGSLGRGRSLALSFDAWLLAVTYVSLEVVFE